MIAWRVREVCDVGHATEARLAGDLLGLELAVEGFEDPVLENVTIAGLDSAEDQAEAGLPGVKDDRLGFERFVVLVNPQQDAALRLKGGGGFDETAHQAELGDTPGKSRFGRAFGGDFCGCVE